MNIPAQDKNGTNWLTFMRNYLVIIVAGNLLWESFQMPFYTLWQEGTWGQIIYSIAHCTVGDILIALSSLTLAIVMIGTSRWPKEKFRPVIILAVVFGVAYCTYSEWLNIVIHRSWSYSDGMPVLPAGSWEIGLLPLLQWIIIPPAGLLLARKWS